MADNAALIEVTRIIQSKPREFFGDFTAYPPLPIPPELFARFYAERHDLPEPVLCLESLPLPNIIFRGVTVYAEDRNDG
jgi:hypothetical protein